MKLIRPSTINDAALTASNVAETDYTAWSGATTYALGDRVRVVGTNIHDIYESLQASNLNYDPATSPTWWVKVSATNRWKMFDTSVSTQTSNADSIAVTVTSPDRINSVALVNVDCASVTVSMTDVTDGVVYNKTVNMVSDSGITDWYAWFFEPIVRLSDKIITGLPSYANAAVAVTLTATGGTALCGALVVGTEKDIGQALSGARVGIQDYSRKEKNAFGDYTIVERAFAKRARFSVLVDSRYVDELVKLLAKYRAIPIVYAATDSRSSTIVFGFYKDFDIVIRYPTFSECSLEIEGLT